MEAKPKEYAHAKALFFNTDLKLKDIAEMLNINRRTLFRWMKEGSWSTAKYAARHTPLQLAEGYYHQLAMLNEAIAERDQPWATKEESEIIRRLSCTIKAINPESRPTLSHTIQVCEDIVDTIKRERDEGALQWINPYLDRHVHNVIDQNNILMPEIARRLDRQNDLDHLEYLKETGQLHTRKHDDLSPEDRQLLDDELKPTNPKKTTENTGQPSTENTGRLPIADCKLPTENGTSPIPRAPWEKEPNTATSKHITYSCNSELSTKNTENGTSQVAEKVVEPAPEKSAESTPEKPVTDTLPTTPQTEPKPEPQAEPQPAIQPQPLPAPDPQPAPQKPPYTPLPHSGPKPRKGIQGFERTVINPTTRERVKVYTRPVTISRSPDFPPLD